MSSQPLGGNSRDGSGRKSVVLGVNLKAHRQPVLGIVLAFAVVAVAGIVLGVVYFQLAKLLYLVLISPIGVSIVGIVVTDRVITHARITSPLAGSLIGLALGIAIYATYSYAGYLQFEVDSARYLQDTYGITLDVARGVVKDALILETGRVGIIGYLDLLSREGVEFSGLLVFQGTAVAGLSDLSLKGALTWLFLALELVLITGPNVAYGIMISKTPFIEAGLHHFGLRNQIGNMLVDSLPTLLHYLEQDNPDPRDSPIIPGESLDHPTVEIYVQLPRNPKRHHGLLTVVRTDIGPGGKIISEGVKWRTIDLDTIAMMQRDADAAEQAKASDESCITTQ